MVAVAFACGLARANPPGVSPTVAPLSYILRVTGGAQPSEALPLVVALHGMDDTPERAFDRTYAGFPVKARFLLPRAPMPHRGVYAWFRFTGGQPLDENELGGSAVEADCIDALATRVAMHQPTSGPRIVVGVLRGISAKVSPVLMPIAAGCFVDPRIGRYASL